MQQNEKLTSSDIRTLGLAALGGALEFYDFIIFVFFTKTLGQLFFPADMPDWLSQFQVYGIFAAGYLARPIGGVIMAHFGDRTGRKKMFTLSVFLMALPTLGIGLLPTYLQIGIFAPLLLLFLRIMQGIAIGGEVPAAWVFVAEHVPRNRVGFACASLTSGLTAGILLGSLMASGLYTQLTPEAVLDYGWRIPFIVGGIFGLMAVWLRKWLSETPVFLALKEKKEISSEIPLKTVMKNHKTSIFVSMLITWMLTAGIVVIILMTPTLMQTQLGISAQEAFFGNNLASFFLIIGCVVGGYFADKIGRLLALLIGSLCLLIAVYVFYFDLVNGAKNFITLYSLAGFCVGVVGIIPSVMVAAFPAQIRFSGLSFSYNMAYAIFGAMTPPLISYLTDRLGITAPAHYVAFTAIITVFTSFYLIKNKKDYLNN
ncbi:MAG: MFS transporter [Bdellovibrionota bacterium]